MIETTVFEFENVGFSYGDNFVLKGFNAKLERGTCLGLMGPGGSGKSTILKLMARLLIPTEGCVRFYGESLGMSFQRSGLFDSMSAGENLRFPLRERSILSAAQIESRVGEFLEKVGLSGVENKRVSELSGGMQKRLGIARAMALRPEVLLLDDPTAGLDPITARQILDVIVGIRKKEVTLVMVSSDPAQLFQVCDRVVLLHEGCFAPADSAIAKQFVRGELLT